MIFRAPLALLLALLSACQATLPVAEDQQRAWQQHRQSLQALRQWDLRGRVALTMNQDAWQLNLRWQNLDPSQQIDLSGPFGAGAVRITIADDGARLVDAEQNTYFAANAQQLLWQTTGWTLPLENMLYWLRGLPVPDKDKIITLNEQGRMKTLRQDGWVLDVLEYAEQGDVWLPHSIELKRSSDPADSKLHVRLVISQWYRRG